MTPTRWGRALGAVLLVLTVAGVSGCEWQGANSLPLPGTAGRGPGSYEVKAQLTDVATIDRNSRVRVGDVTVGSVTKIERQGWHALVTMRLAGDVRLPANATAKVGQTSLLGSMHIELALPAGVPPAGKLADGSLIPLSSGDAYPTTEQTLASVSVLLNGGGLGQLQDITKALSTAFAGREDDLRSLLTQLDVFVGRVDDQTDDIVMASASLNGLARQLADQKPVMDDALRTVPEALAVVNSQRSRLVDALDGLGKLSALTASTVDQTKRNLVRELQQLGPILESAANAGPALTRSLSQLATFPWPNETMEKWLRGDYGNLTAVVDLTLSRLDQSLFTGTRFEGDLTKLELQWGRTIGQMPSPYTGGNPLIAAYNLDQGP